MTVRMDHFSRRCIERGIRSISGTHLREAILWAIEQARSDLVEYVFRIDEADFWRFRVEEGIFYAVAIEGRIVTVFNRKMMREKRGARRLAKKLRGRRDVRPK